MTWSQVQIDYLPSNLCFDTGKSKISQEALQRESEDLAQVPAQKETGLIWNLHLNMNLYYQTKLTRNFGQQWSVQKNLKKEKSSKLGGLVKGRSTHETDQVQAAIITSHSSRKVILMPHRRWQVLQ